MPIYEYQALDPKNACPDCRQAFEAFQSINEKPLNSCPSCGRPVRKIISWCHGAVMETSDEHTRVTRAVKEHESQGRWSHAAELADKHSEKTKDRSLKMRAIDNYKKAGYDDKSLARHADTKND